MSKDILERAHRLYQLEGDYLERLLSQEPAYAALAARLELAEARLLAGGPRDPGQAQAATEARRLLMEISREAAFKMGYLMAHAHSPDEEAGL
ncbi:MAG: hypothetical protein HY794_15195 [Desulfarculus sp.]|nr:hypothetical protein [Desulfarculus sp.]